MFRRHFLAFMAGTLVAGMSPFFGQAQERTFTVRDSVEMTRFSNPWAEDKDARAGYSPDDRYFVVVTTRGLIKTNEVESTLRIYDAASVREFLSAPASAPHPAPKASAKFSAVPRIRVSQSYGPLVTALRWSPDSQLLYFLAQNSHAEKQLYRINVRSGETKALTAVGYDVHRFDFTKDTLVYTASHTADEVSVGDVVNNDERAVTGVPLKAILFPQQNVPKPSKLEFIRNGTTHQVVDTISGAPQANLDEGLLSISPGGQEVIELLPVKNVPTSWKSYQPIPGYDYTLRINPSDPRFTSPFFDRRLSEYALVSLPSGKTIPLIDAPHGATLGYLKTIPPVWSSDGQRVLLSNTFLPLDGPDSKERFNRLQPCAVAEVEISPRHVSCIVFVREGDTKEAHAPGRGWLQLQEASFGASENNVVLRFSGPDGASETERYQFDGGTWKLNDAGRAENLGTSHGASQRDEEPLSITIRQSLNDPPTLWATDPKTQRSKEILNPNPQFAHIKFGDASTYQWKDKTGREWEGVLIKPVNYVPGERYPMVIQTHGFWDWAFMTDGNYPTAMAARPLASAGILVLQTTYRHDFKTGPEDLAEHVEEYASAIQQLATDGLADPHRVGAIGFSWTCAHVQAALIQEPTLLAAAAITDGNDNSYMQYHFWGEEVRQMQKHFEELYGAKPVGDDGLKKWIDNAPDFHLDRVVTPLRIEALNPDSVINEWEIYSSLRQQEKPVDLVYIADGQHVLQRPLDIFASEQGNVDWFRFWLQGYKDSDPAKREQYERWEHLSELRTGDLARDVNHGAAATSMH
jgi:dipeptidyl aminopeptidase/acylaminoacyl peptidase